MNTILQRAFNQLRPRYGWLGFLLLALLLAALLGATLEVDWVPQTAVVVPLATGGFLLSVLLAHSTLRSWMAWLILPAAGLALSVALLADLRPPRVILLGGEPSLADFLGQRLVVFGDRVGSWFSAVVAGESSTETLAFALGLGLVAWLVGALLAWSVYRRNRPLAGIAVAATAMALTGYFGQAPLYWPAAFIGLAVTAIATLHYAALEADWERRGVDYSSEVRSDLLIAAAATGMLLMSLAVALPSINVRAIASAFREQPAVSEAEAALERAFAGVEQPRLDDSARQTYATRPAGVMPRAFLLGAAPELLETVVMTATVTLGSGGTAVDNPDPHLAGVHWRGASYDIYTGRGWRRSGEREQIVPAGAAVQQAREGPGTVTVSQVIDWAINPLPTRYTLGTPLRFSHDTVTHWRGDDDLSRVSASGDLAGRYEAVSWLSPWDEHRLRQVSIDDTPLVLLSRHTALPADLPQRVRELAREVAFSNPDATPYDQARAIEQFLRQYPYSLDVPLPPEDVDMVDYFLFDLQRGFCDYYATAMVVMARSVGLPARLATGFLQATPDASGAQLIRQSSAHSWAELYFPGFGWVEFEPTAPTAAPESPVYAGAPTVPDSAAGDTPSATATSPVALPERAPQRDWPWPFITVAAFLGSLIVVLLGRRFWRRRQATSAGLDAVESAYATLRQQAADLGIRGGPGETPLEFAATVDRAAGELWHAAGSADAPPGTMVNRAAELYAHHRYGGRGEETPSPAVADEARQLTRSLRASFRRLRWKRWRAALRRLRPARPQPR